MIWLAPAGLDQVQIASFTFNSDHCVLSQITPQHSADLCGRFNFYMLHPKSPRAPVSPLNCDDTPLEPLPVLLGLRSSECQSAVKKDVYQLKL